MRLDTRALLHPALALVLAAVLTGCATTPLETRPAAEQVVLDLPPTWAAKVEVGPLSNGLLDLVGDARLRQLVLEALGASHEPRAACGGSPAGGVAPAAGRDSCREVADRNLRLVSRAWQPGCRRAGRATSRDPPPPVPRVSWEVDVWRRLGDLHAAEAASTASQAAELAAARDALGARVIQAWVTAVSLRQSIAVEAERIRLLERLQGTITRRYRRGIGDLDDLAAARSGTELARATSAGLEADLGQAHRALELLLGRMPRDELASAEALPTVATASRVCRRRPSRADPTWSLLCGACNPPMRPPPPLPKPGCRVSS